jgi:hypothetical protein
MTSDPLAAHRRHALNPYNVIQQQGSEFTPYGGQAFNMGPNGTPTKVGRDMTTHERRQAKREWVQQQVIESSQSDESQKIGFTEEWEPDVKGEETTLGGTDTEPDTPMPAYHDQLIDDVHDYETNFVQLTKVHDTITDFKDIASLWLLSLRPHKYLKELRTELDLFVIRLLLNITEIQAMLEGDVD